MRFVFLTVSLTLSVALALALAGCGKYGPPVRAPEKSAALAPDSSTEEDREEDPKESKK